MYRYVNLKLIMLFVMAISVNWSHVFAATNEFRGVNWADQRDNFQPGVIYLSGLTSADTYNSASIVADRIISQFISKIGSNSVRMPINEATVSNYWNTYTGAIDVALAKGKVILCYWSHTFGARPANMDGFWAMWKKVVDKYGSNENCYFEVFNEPAAYSKEEIRELYAEWIRRYSSVPHGRIILDGTGAAQNVPDIGSDTRFKDCLLAVHDYSFFGYFTSEQQWTGHLRGQVGDYSDRTVITEFGAPMKPGSRDGNYYDYQDYNQPAGSYFVAYYRGMTQQAHDWNMGTFYWPGLRDGDWYSMTTKSGSGSTIELTINNQSGLDRLKYSWTNFSNFDLSINTIGQGTVASDPNSSNYEKGASVSLTAQPQAGWAFVGWSGSGVSGSQNPLTITMDTNMNITAAFSRMPVNGNLVLNGDFNSGSTEWAFNVWSGTASASIVNGEYRIAIQSVADKTHDIQLLQQGLYLENGKTYEVAFDAYASASRTLDVNVQMAGSPWTSYLEDLKQFTLSTTKQTFKFTFTMMGSNDFNGRVVFNAGTAIPAVTIDNVSVKLYDPTPVTNQLRRTVRPAIIFNRAGTSLTVYLASYSSESAVLQLVNLNGKIMKSVAIRSSANATCSQICDLSDIPKGLYIVRLMQGGNTVGSFKMPPYRGRAQRIDMIMPN